MVLDKVFDYSNEKLKYGFLYTNKENRLSLSDIVNSAKENIIFCDTNSYIIDDLLPIMSNILNDNKIIVMGLINDKSLLDLKKKGIRGGFFRSTSLKVNASVIIIDKTYYYIAFDSNNVFEMADSKAYNEVFEYINHLIWTATTNEFCQGDYREIKDSRLSVVKPAFHAAKEKVSDAVIGTEDINVNTFFSTVEKDYNKPCILLEIKIPSSYMLNGILYTNLFEDKYYGIKEFDSSYVAKSFENQTYSSLVGKEIWYDDKHIVVNNNDKISKNYFLPLDEYKSFVPNYDEIVKNDKPYTLSLKVICNVEPMTVDSSYKVHPNYKNYESLDLQVSSNLEKLIKLDDSKLNKVIKKIQDERSLSERIRRYNEIIKDKEFGVEALVDKKNAFKQINFNESDIIIPSELIGKLYMKEKKNYLALNSESKIDDAKKWLKDNKLEAVLILGKED